MPVSRPEYTDIIKFLDISESDNYPLAFLARSGGAKVTDSFEIFCYPKSENNKSHLHFFAHGLRYLPECSIERISKMQREDRILLAHDFQNPFETDALQLRTLDNYIIGYCPSYLPDDVNKMRGKEEIEVCVERINDESASLQFRLMCRLIFPQMDGHKPFSNRNYAPVSNEMGKTADNSHITFA